jgi:hypothetical protein
MRHVLAAVAVLHVCVPGVWADEPPPIAQQLQQISRQLAEITSRLEKLEKAIREPRPNAQGLFGPHADQIAEQQRQRQEQQAKMREALAKIHLPEDATRRDVENYVNDILAATPMGQGMSSNDPQPEMLRRVGPEHVDVLLDALGRRGTDWHVWQAVTNLVRPEHKRLVIDRLQAYPPLIELVERMRWEDDAQPVIVEAIRRQAGPVPATWLRLATRGAEPKDYEAFKDFLVHVENRPETYEAIRRLKGIELDSTVAQAWREARTQARESWRFAPIAVSHGVLDALDFLVENIDKRHEMMQALMMMGDDHDWRWHDPGGGLGRPRFFDEMRDLDPRNVVLRHIEFRGTNAEIIQWFREHKPRLVFDRQRRIFVVGPGVAQRQGRLRVGAAA